MTRNRHDPPRASDRRPDSDDRAADAVAHSFLLRLWQETRADAAEQAIWRGTVSDLRGRQLGSFSSAAELVRILGPRGGIDVMLRVSCTETGPEPAADACSPPGS
ncbi:MAG: hypothetical protein ACREO8_09645 [Luteimonas sp.]